MPQMFFAFNNGISATAMDVVIETNEHGRFITFARDFQIINGGQTTASISNARYKDKANIEGLYVQMKLTEIDESTPEESDELIRNISRSSNSQNKVSDADFLHHIRSIEEWNRFPVGSLPLLRKVLSMKRNGSMREHEDSICRNRCA